MSRLLCIALLLAVLSRSGAAQSAGSSTDPQKKIIYYGWDTRDTGYVRDHWKEMEQMPFNGIAISVAFDETKRTVGNGSTANLLGWQTFGPTAFDLNSFQSAIANLQTPVWTRFTDNFLPVSIATRDQDQGLTWFDDTRWAIIENNWRILVTIAHEGGCRGILLDPEHYDYGCELFSWQDHNAQRVAKPFDQYVAQARARGQQLGAAMREIFPNMTVGLLYGYALASNQVTAGHALQDTRYSLLPAFLDGLLEATDSQTTFVDLWEFGLGYKRQQQFLDGYDAIKNGALSFTAVPEIYTQKMQAGFSTQIDYGTARKPWDTVLFDANHFAPRQLRKALGAALDTSESYVWLYSESGPRFFPRKRLPQKYLDAIAESPTATPQARTQLVPIYVGGAGLLATVAALSTQRRKSSTEKQITAEPEQRQ
jgi:hypothetical protein